MMSKRTEFNKVNDELVHVYKGRDHVGDICLLHGLWQVEVLGKRERHLWLSDAKNAARKVVRTTATSP